MSEPFPGRARASLMLFAIMVSTMSLWACKDDVIDNAQREEIFRIFRTGVEQRDDPYVRAETLRILEIIEDPELNQFAEPLLEDPDPMVRIAALRVLLATSHPEIRLKTLEAYSNAEGAERRAILGAVIEYGSPPLRREITGRALRQDDPVLREMAFLDGPLSRVDEAIEAGKTDYLDKTLLPELVPFLEREQGHLAALALQRFLAAGQADRIEAFVRDFENSRLSVEERVAAGRIMIYGRATGAREVFEGVVARYDEAMADDSLGIPAETAAPELLRIAILGSVASGNTQWVDRAKQYLTSASTDETLEVLESLANNPSEEASIALKVAMQDSRDEVRNRAIALYEDREDSVAQALMKAQRGAPYATQRRIATVLMRDHAETWVELLRAELTKASRRVEVLNLLRDAIVTRAEVEAILVPLEGDLEAVLNETGEESTRALAAYLLAITRDVDIEGLDELDARFDDETRYAFLEFEMRTRPVASQHLFRKYFNADNYAKRLMASAGLWRVAVESKVSESEKAADDSEKTADES